MKAKLLQVSVTPVITILDDDNETLAVLPIEPINVGGAAYKKGWALDVDAVCQQVLAQYQQQQSAAQPQQVVLESPDDVIPTAPAPTPINRQARRHPAKSPAPKKTKTVSPRA